MKETDDFRVVNDRDFEDFLLNYHRQIVRRDSVDVSEKCFRDGLGGTLIAKVALTPTGRVHYVSKSAETLMYAHQHQLTEERVGAGGQRMQIDGRINTGDALAFLT